MAKQQQIQREIRDKILEKCCEAIPSSCMQKSLKSSTTQTPAPQPEYLGFQTVLNKVVWPIAVLKFNGKDAYCWDWMTGGPGYSLLHVDFGTQNVGSFGKYKESHVSYHESGRRHSLIRNKTKRLCLSVTHGTPVTQIQQPISIASVPAPLTSPPLHKLNTREWNRATNRITLRSCDFADHQDIYLRVYLCGKESVHLLAKRFRFGTWMLGSGNTRLVIAADLY